MNKYPLMLKFDYESAEVEQRTEGREPLAIVRNIIKLIRST
ncbi:MAG: hypothetical protein ACKOW3_08730 [Hyphomicrobium sp.]